MTTTEQYRPQTAVERELLADCIQIATMHGIDVAEVLADAVKFWGRAGRNIRPRQWRSRMTAAERLIARGRAIAEHTTAGIDPFVDVPRFARLSAEQLHDSVTYLADYQG
jgi:type II secretory pathway component PulL